MFGKTKRERGEYKWEKNRIGILSDVGEKETGMGNRK